MIHTRLVSARLSEMEIRALHCHKQETIQSHENMNGKMLISLVPCMLFKCICVNIMDTTSITITTTISTVTLLNLYSYRFLLFFVENNSGCDRQRAPGANYSVFNFMNITSKFYHEIEMVLHKQCPEILLKEGPNFIRHSTIISCG